MRKLLGVLLVLGIPSPALPHKVPWDAADPAFQPLRDNRQDELSNQLARFCYVLNREPQACVKDLHAQHGNKGLAAAAACMMRWTELDPDLQEIMHKTDPTRIIKDPEICRRDTTCHWHLNYENQKGEDGWGIHRHEYSAGLRDAIAREYAMAQVGEFVKNYNGSSTENKATTGSKTGAELNAKTGGVLAAAAGEASMGVSHSQANGQEIKNIEHGPSREERDAVHDAAYRSAFNYPERYSGRSPDVLCIKNQDDCRLRPTMEPYPNTGAEIRIPAASSENDPPITPLSPPPKPAKPADPPKEDPENCACADKNFYPYDPKQKTTAPTNPLQLEQLLEGCIHGALAVDPTMETTDPLIPPDNRTLKERAEEQLTMGKCLREYYGDAFCNQFYAVPEGISEKLIAIEHKENKAKTTPGYIEIEPTEAQKLEDYCDYLQEQLDKITAAEKQKTATSKLWKPKTGGEGEETIPDHHGLVWDAYVQNCLW